MEIIDKRTKGIMEGCKERARDAGLSFDDESLEYIVTNRDLLELSPKVMMPNMYDYWVHDVQALLGIGRYSLYPNNPYETVINTRPAISFYNDNNPDWLNVMIFYHVLAHIDFFQNNQFFAQTWDYDMNGQMLADKRLIADYRTKYGRWVDYVIEFARGIDNIVDYQGELSAIGRDRTKPKNRFDYFFDVFFSELKMDGKNKITEYQKEVATYNKFCKEYGDVQGEEMFFLDVYERFPEFGASFKKYKDEFRKVPMDIMEYLIQNSEHLNKYDNLWKKEVMTIVRNTSIFFQPQIRTKIMNEGWASIWHEMLFLEDSRMEGHEVEFARLNAGVTAMPRVGLNPYALGMRLFYYIEEMVNEGKRSFEYDRILDVEKRRKFDLNTGKGRDFIFEVRKELCDNLFISRFIDQDFVDKHKLFVVGDRDIHHGYAREFYAKSRKADDYKNMVLDSLYDPPRVTVDEEGGINGVLRLKHHFAGKSLKLDWIENVMLGIEQLWGNPVELVTRMPKGESGWQKMKYTMNNKTLSKRAI